MKEIQNYNEIFNELSSYSSKQELLLSFGRDYYKSISFQNLNSTKIADSFSITNFLGVSFPIGERIFKCLNQKASVDFILVNEFIHMIEIFFFANMSQMASFFFKLIDFNEDKTIIIEDCYLFFGHINFASEINKSQANQLIEDFFGSKKQMTHEEFTLRIGENADIALLFYYYVYHMKCFNEEVISYYEKNAFESNIKSENCRKVQSVKCINTFVAHNCLKQERKYSNNDSEFKGIKPDNMLSINAINNCVISKMHKDYHCSNKLISYLNTNYRLNNRPLIIGGNQTNSFETSNTEQNAHEQNEDIEFLNEFEKDKMASFDNLANLSQMIINNEINPDIKSNSNIISTNPNSNTNNTYNDNDIQDNDRLDKDKDNISKPNKKNPFPYRINNQRTKMGCMSAQMSSLDKSLSLCSITLNTDKIAEDKDKDSKPSQSSSSSVSSNLVFNNVIYSSFIKVKLIVVNNFLFLKEESSENKYRLILLKSSFISKSEDTSLIIHSSQEKKHHLTFPNNKKLQLFITYFNRLNNIKTIENKYEVIEEIGQGHFGKITKVKCKSDLSKEYILKTIPKDNNPYLKLAKWEAYIASYLSIYSHLNIIRFYDVYETTKNVYIAMEYFPSKTINEDDLKDITQTQSSSIMNQLIAAIHFLHSNGIIHRDIKLDNILYCQSDDQIKVIDFGLSKVLFPTESTGEFCGTLSFTAPEVITRQKYDFSADIWSLGIIAYIFEFKEYPYNVDKVKIEQMLIEISQLLSKIVIENCYYWKETLLRVIIKNSLIKNPKERYNSNQLRNLFVTN